MLALRAVKSTRGGRRSLFGRGLSSTNGIPNRVGIIGGGVAGLQAAKCLVRRGL